MTAIKRPVSALITRCLTVVVGMLLVCGYELPMFAAKGSSEEKRAPDTNLDSMRALSCSNLFSPNERRAQAPRPMVRMVLFRPADVSMPADAKKRLTQIADAAEKFYFKWMDHWGYPALANKLVQREADGLVQVLEVKGDLPVSSDKYAKPTYAQEVIDVARRSYNITRKGDVWWIFVYLGDRPARFDTYVGAVRNGEGRAMVNYDTIPGEIRPDLGLAEGFNGEWFLKGTIHELGHALGLPHIGPDLTLELGNSLMGPTTLEYQKRKCPKAEQVYLCQASAAMLWKHPIFDNKTADTVQPVSAKLVEYAARFDRTNSTVIIHGRVVSKPQAHSVVLIDDLGRPRDPYWAKGHTARVAPDGNFELSISEPAKAALGHYQIRFCFENGWVGGENTQEEIRKAYRFRNNRFEFHK